MNENEEKARYLSTFITHRLGKEFNRAIIRGVYQDGKTDNDWVLVTQHLKIPVSDVCAKGIPLDQISLIHAIEVLKIFRLHDYKIHYQIRYKRSEFNERFAQVYSEDYSKDGGFQGIDNQRVHINFSSDGFHAVQSNNGETHLKAYDYVRSNGYAVSYNGYTIDQLIQKGWLRLKEK